MSDFYSLGFAHALELRHTPAARAQLAVAALWPADRLRGYLDGIESCARVRACTCHDCPLHGNGDRPAPAGAS